ncbi:Minichromosome maintenance domain-containing protein 2 [Merluccius polli]|uniref:Minichromosome maintenance domain-containing protein 2 n=1 Tax=Merluccius polli TaxID=89951 RepID=A0AA47NRD5_MERPO|nr:Minichromosome maintenance domain-containing protein 2 [Merluccius polli]
MDDTLALKESVLFYLDRSGGLVKLVQDCELFDDPQHSEAVYRFCVSVNPSDVMDLDPVLGDRVLHDPLAATRLFRSVNVILKLTHLPPFPEYTLDLRASPRSYGPSRPFAMEGLVVAVTRTTKYTQGARFLCNDEGCPCSTGFHHIRVHSPGATESATVRNDFSCLVCRAPLREDVTFRVLGDKQLVELIHVGVLPLLNVHPPSSLRYQSVTLFLRDELCHSMRLGRLYRVLGTPALVHQWPGVTWSVEANSVQAWEPVYPHQVSEGFQALLKATAGSPWRFPGLLAHSFGCDVVPPGRYNTLKLALLLSLVQTTPDSADTFHSLDLLALASDTLLIDRLMAYSLSLAVRGVRHQLQGEMFASLSRDEHGAGTANIHAGSALLASGGVCMLGDLGGYRKDKLDAIQSVLESRAVGVFVPGRKYGEETDQQLSFPVQCSFWALADSTEPLLRRSSTLLGTVEMGPKPSQLAESFGLVVRCSDTVGGEAVLAQTAHTLSQAVTPGSQPLYPASVQLPFQDYQEFLAHARGLSAGLSSGAEKMIHGYYMASRRVRSDQNHGVNVSVASVKLLQVLLITLAEAHCKLCLRTTVQAEDALMAVLLCENAITLRQGASVLVIPPDAAFPCALGGDVGALRQRELLLDDLQQDVLRFIYAYAPGANSYIAEE